MSPLPQQNADKVREIRTELDGALNDQRLSAQEFSKIKNDLRDLRLSVKECADLRKYIYEKQNIATDAKEELRRLVYEKMAESVILTDIRSLKSYLEIAESDLDVTKERVMVTSILAEIVGVLQRRGYSVIRDGNRVVISGSDSPIPSVQIQELFDGYLSRGKIISSDFGTALALNSTQADAFIASKTDTHDQALPGKQLDLMTYRTELLAKYNLVGLHYQDPDLKAKIEQNVSDRRDRDFLISSFSSPMLDENRDVLATHAEVLRKFQTLVKNESMKGDVAQTNMGPVPMKYLKTENGGEQFCKDFMKAPVATSMRGAGEILNASGSSAPIVLMGMLYFGFKLLTGSLDIGGKKIAGWQVLLGGLFGHGLLKAFGAIDANGEVNSKLKEGFSNTVQKGREKLDAGVARIQKEVAHQKSRTEALKHYRENPGEYPDIENEKEFQEMYDRLVVSGIMSDAATVQEKLGSSDIATRNDVIKEVGLDVYYPTDSDKQKVAAVATTLVWAGLVGAASTTVSASQKVPNRSSKRSKNQPASSNDQSAETPAQTPTETPEQLKQNLAQKIAEFNRVAEEIHSSWGVFKYDEKRVKSDGVKFGNASKELKNAIGACLRAGLKADADLGRLAMAKYYAGQSIDNDKNKDYMASLGLGYAILEWVSGAPKLPTPPTQEQVFAQLDSKTKKLILQRSNAGEKDIGAILANPGIKEGFQNVHNIMLDLYEKDLIAKLQEIDAKQKSGSITLDDTQKQALAMMIDILGAGGMFDWRSRNVDRMKTMGGSLAAMGVGLVAFAGWAATVEFFGAGAPAMMWGGALAGGAVTTLGTMWANDEYIWSWKGAVELGMNTVAFGLAGYIMKAGQAVRGAHGVFEASLASAGALGVEGTANWGLGVSMDFTRQYFEGMHFDIRDSAVNNIAWALLPLGFHFLPSKAYGTWGAETPFPKPRMELARRAAETLERAKIYVALGDDAAAKKLISELEADIAQLRPGEALDPTRHFDDITTQMRDTNIRKFVKEAELTRIEAQTGNRLSTLWQDLVDMEANIGRAERLLSLRKQRIERQKDVLTQNKINKELEIDNKKTEISQIEERIKTQQDVIASSWDRKIVNDAKTQKDALILLRWTKKNDLITIQNELNTIKWQINVLDVDIKNVETQINGDLANLNKAEKDLTKKIDDLIADRQGKLKPITNDIANLETEIKRIQKLETDLMDVVLKLESMPAVSSESAFSVYGMYGEFQKDIRALKTGESLKIGEITIKKEPKGEYTLSKDGEASPFYTTKKVDGAFLETIRAGETGTEFMQYEMNRLAAKATDPKFLEHLKGKEFELGSDRYRVTDFDITNPKEPKPKIQKLEANGKLRDLTPDELEVVEGSLNEQLFTFVSRRGDQILADLAKNRTPLNPNEGQLSELFHTFQWKFSKETLKKWTIGDFFENWKKLGGDGYKSLDVWRNAVLGEHWVRNSLIIAGMTVVDVNQKDSWWTSSELVKNYCMFRVLTMPAFIVTSIVKDGIIDELIKK